MVFELPSPEGNEHATRSHRVTGNEMGKFEGTVWICGTAIVLWILFYSVGGVDLVVSAYKHIVNPPPAAAQSAQSP
jgi:hypothetical protein